MTEIIDGKGLAKKIRENLKKAITKQTVLFSEKENKAYRTFHVNTLR